MSTKGEKLLTARVIGDVAIARNGRNAVLLLSTQRPRRLTSRLAYNVPIVIQPEPHGPKTWVNLIVESEWLWHHAHKIIQLPIDQALPTFASLSVGEYLDETTLPPLPAGEEPAAIIELSRTLNRLKQRDTATYEEIQLYLEAKIYWNWQFRNPTTRITQADLARLATSLNAVQQVASLREESSGLMRHPGDSDQRAA